MGSLEEDFLPVELVLAQLPSRFLMDERTFEIEYVPIGIGTDDGKVLVVISDVTAQVEAEHAEAAQRELMRFVERLTKDRAGVVEFMREAETLLDHLAGPRLDLAVQRRFIHTLKGNTAIFGVDSVATRCHELEGAIEERQAMATPEEIDELRGAWDAFADRISPLLDRADVIELSQDEYEALVRDLVNRRPHEGLLERALAWAQEPVEARLERVGEQARALASRLGRAELEVETEGNGLRLDPQRWGSFWSAFGHVVRNAVDHGIEPPEERALAGKAPRGHLAVRARIDDSHFVIDIEDDGRGIDWDKLADRARARGLEAETLEEKVRVLCTDGITTRDDVSEISGRGVGMHAVLHETEALGGHIEVESGRGRGTTFQFVFPKDVLTVGEERAPMRRSA